MNPLYHSPESHLTAYYLDQHMLMRQHRLRHVPPARHRKPHRARWLRRPTL